MEVGTEVLHESKKYRILYIYDTGYCEIQEIQNPRNIILIKVEELTPLK